MYNFFDYKDFIKINGEAYHGQDYFSLTHIIFMVIATIAIIETKRLKLRFIERKLSVT